MNILIITGIFEETEAIIKSFKGTSFSFDKDLRMYSSDYQGNTICLISAGPGFRKKKEIRRALRRINPNYIINCGLTGVLEKASDLKKGQAIIPSDVLSAGNNISLTCSNSLNTESHYKIRSEKCISLDNVIYHPEEKMDLFLKTGAVICDMELYPLLALINREFPELVMGFISLKIVSDFPEDYRLYKNEVYLRGWSSKNAAEKIIALLTFPGGPFKGLKLKFRKYQMLHRLGPELKYLIDSWKLNK